MKLCKDCKWAKRDWVFFWSPQAQWKFAKCTRKTKTEASPVDGEPSTVEPYCAIERLGMEQWGDCGASAQFFESKKSAEAYDKGKV